MDTTSSGSEDSELAGFTIADFFRKNGALPGADFFVLGNGSLDRCGRHALLLTSLWSEKGPLVQEVVIILPPGQTEETARTGIETAYRQQAIELHSLEQEKSDQITLSPKIRFETMATFDAPALVELIRASHHPAAFVVPWAARYRKPLDLPAIPEAPEDVWVPELHALGESVVETVYPVGSYVVLDAGEWWPERQRHQDLLSAVDHCGVATASNPGLSLLALTTLRQRWIGLARAGEIATALGEIASQPSLSPAQRVFNRMTAFNEAGFIIETVAEFTREKDVIDAEKGDGALLFVGPAIEAGLTEPAQSLLTRAYPELSRAETMQMALRHADDLGDAALAEAIEATLGERYPRSPLLVERSVRRLVAEDRRGDAALRLEETGNADAGLEAAYLRWLDAELTAEPLEPERVLAKCRVAFPACLARARRATATALERAGRRAEAFDLLLADVGDTSEQSRANVWAAMEMLERGILTLDAACDSARAATVVGESIRWLSRNPLDGHVRLKVADLLSPQMIGGAASTAVIAKVCLQYGERDVSLRPSTPVEQRPRPCDPKLLSPILRTGMEHFEREPGTVLGRSRFPADKLSIPADEAVAGFVELLEYAGETYGEGDATAIENYLLVATSLATLGTQPDADLMLLRTAGGKFALHGQAQRARDLAEHALNIAGTDPHRIRVAWYSFADLYHRSGHVIEALIGYACALAADSAVDGDQLWYESHLGIRLFRDIGLIPLLPPLMTRARAALAIAGLTERRGHWLDTIELQIRLAGVNRKALDSDEVAGLMADTTANLRAVIENNDDAGPATMLLASIARIARNAGILVPTDVEAAIAEGRARLGDLAQTLLAITTDAAPDKETVARLAAAIDAARYADDVGFDLRHLAIGAKRLLEVGTDDPDTAAFAIEIISDLGLPAPSGGRVTELPKEVGVPARYAREVAAEGIDVVMLGLANNRLTRVIFSQTEASIVVEDEEIFSGTSLREWRERYPHAYQDPKRDTSHDFFLSTRHLGLSKLPARAVIVAETGLQALPPNILQINRQLAGQEHRLALAPSITWLRDARRTAFKGDGAIRAWIPNAEPAEGLPALAVLADRLRASFENHAVELFNGEDTPTELSNSDMVIIGAHGDVGEDKRYFRVVTDDVDLALASSTVSGALRDIGVVVLFVCSGGRIDKHPGASTTIGLTKQLLARGCRAVVAPPWSLETSVPPVWLPTFLDRWMAHAPVIDACFDANAAVRAARGADPAADLAMTVYGDPLIARPAR
ncbi:CHAT domain-containing protein [Mesorhizobium sp.]|uniref:CHAT domain-containing protein n=1 Tax=Mesorhizobium sp. TaxID=1871066 RepID=UPI000FE62312|nr:CHAT domain-containing protein [Mesorhizobium sp.]RWP10646.1 MAG: CHAT domain-containing protein [Mesorhizobium sp.]